MYVCCMCVRVSAASPAVAADVTPSQSWFVFLYVFTQHYRFSNYRNVLMSWSLTPSSCIELV